MNASQTHILPFIIPKKFTTTESKIKPEVTGTGTGIEPFIRLFKKKINEIYKEIHQSLGNNDTNTINNNILQRIKSPAADDGAADGAAADDGAAEATPASDVNSYFKSAQIGLKERIKLLYCYSICKDQTLFDSTFSNLYNGYTNERFESDLNYWIQHYYNKTYINPINNIIHEIDQDSIDTDKMKKITNILKLIYIFQNQYLDG